MLRKINKRKVIKVLPIRSMWYRLPRRQGKLFPLKLQNIRKFYNQSLYQ